MFFREGRLKKRKKIANENYRAKLKAENEKKKTLKLRVNGKLVNVPVDADNVSEVTVVVPSASPQQEKAPSLTPDNTFLRKKQRSSVYNQKSKVSKLSYSCRY